MTCPFLKEAQVKYCQTAAVRKLIPIVRTGRADEKCSSVDHATCPVYRAQPEDGEPAGLCPYLRESLMQYCAAASVAKLVPYSESLLSRCGNDGFRYCELYLTMLHPGARAEHLDGIAMPGGLRYSANHMWLDVTEDGTCHAGIDAFLSRALGTVERIVYVWLRGEHRPAAVLTAGGVDYEVVFPNPLVLTNCNLYLRADPARLTAEPYTAGWLFEGKPGPGTARGLLEGEPAREWMEQEQRRINEFLQHGQTLQTGPLAADGGLFAAGLPRYLDREQMLTLFHEFFSPYAGGKRDL
jgi:glycine cleavage system H lipoate-binding protein